MAFERGTSFINCEQAFRGERKKETNFFLFPLRACTEANRLAAQLCKTKANSNYFHHHDIGSSGQTVFEIKTHFVFTKAVLTQSVLHALIMQSCKIEVLNFS